MAAAVCGYALAGFFSKSAKLDSRQFSTCAILILCPKQNSSAHGLAFEDAMTAADCHAAHARAAKARAGGKAGQTHEGLHKGKAKLEPFGSSVLTFPLLCVSQNPVFSTKVMMSPISFCAFALFVGS